MPVDVSIGEMIQTGVIAPAVAILWAKTRSNEAALRDLRESIRELTNHLIRGDISGKC